MTACSVRSRPLPIRFSPRQVSVLLIAALLGAFMLRANAQGFPSKPIHLVVPTVPGGSVDLVARRIGQKAAEAMGQPLVVENPSGASGITGTHFVARSAPDGHTLVFVTVGQVIGVLYLNKEVPYNPLRDLQPVFPAVEAVSLVSVHPSVPANNMKELVDYARANPGKLAYGSTGVGSYFHLSIEALKSFAGLDMLHVPYKGMPPLMNDLAGGRIQFAYGAVASTAPFQSRLRVLATTEPQRWPGMPDVPAVAESLPGFEKVPTWYAFFGPAGLPRPVLSRLNGELQKATDSPDVRKWILDNGMTPLGGTPEQLAAMHKRGIEVYGQIVKAVGIKPE